MKNEKDTLYSIAKIYQDAIDAKEESEVNFSNARKEIEKREIEFFKLLKEIQHINQDALEQINDATDKYITFFKELNNFYQDGFPIKFHNLEKMPEFKYAKTNIQELNKILAQYELSNNKIILRAQKSIVLRGPEHMDGISNIYTLPRGYKLEEGFGLKIFGAAAALGAGITASSINNNTPEIIIQGSATITIAGLGASALLIEKDTFNKAANLLEERKKYVHEAISSIDKYITFK